MSEEPVVSKIDIDMDASAVDFKPGDVVRLRSGGPLMTISGEEQVAGKPFLVVVHFHDGEVKRERLRREVLLLVERGNYRE